MTAAYKTDLLRFGLKFFGGFKAGTLDETFTFNINQPSKVANPFVSAVEDGKQSVLEFSRLSAPIPSILPSYNQIGFDSLHYIGGAVAKNAAGQLVMWVIGGRQSGKHPLSPQCVRAISDLMDLAPADVGLLQWSGDHRQLRWLQDQVHRFLGYAFCLIPDQ